jgi:hypothetical protein
VDLSRLEQALLTVRKVEEGLECRFVLVGTNTSCGKEGQRREKVENVDLTKKGNLKSNLLPESNHPNRSAA